MKRFISLTILARFRGLFEALGCDFPMLMKILQVKLTMDQRRVPTVLNNRSSQRQNQERNGFVRSLWIYALFSLMTLPLVMMNNNSLFSMTLAFAMIMFLIMTSMISDFSSVLLDIRDRIILSTRPVNKRTLNFARVIHITIYLTLLTGALTGIPLIAALSKHGVLFFLVFLLDIILMDILIMVFTALLYLLVLHFFDGERLKDIINYVQIALSIAMVLGYQLMSHTFALIKVHIIVHSAWWQALLPPFWFGSTFKWLSHQQQNAQTIFLSVLAIAAPTVLFVLYLFLMPAFERKLNKLASGEAASKKSRQGLFAMVSRIVSPNPQERAWFQFATIMMSRERDFKLKVYPSLGFGIALPLIIVFNSAWSHGFTALSHGHWYLAVYASALMVPSAILMLGYSSRYQAAWIYKTAPLHTTAAIFKGTLKAFLIRLFLPVFTIESIIFIVLSGLHTIFDMIIAGMGISIYSMLAYLIVGKTLPFAAPYQIGRQNNRYVILILLPLIGVFAAFHYVASLFHDGLYVYFVLLLVLNIVIWRFGFNESVRKYFDARMKSDIG